MQDSSHLDDIAIPYEVDGFEMPKNRNGMMKEKESERGRENERENGRERERDRVMSSSAPVIHPAVCVSYSVCSSIDATDTGSGTGLGFRGDRHDIQDNSFIEARYRPISDTLIYNCDLNESSIGDVYHSNVQYSGSI